MISKTTAFLGILLLILAIGVPSTSNIHAAGATQVTRPMAGDGAGEVTVTINNGNFTISIRSTGLAPGHVHSVWVGFPGSKVNLTGGVTSVTGAVSLTGKVKSTLTSGTIALVVKDHGEPIPGEVHDQMTTKSAGCGGPCPSVQTASIPFS